MPIEDASEYQLIFEDIKVTVKPERDNNRSDRRRLNWWEFGVNALQMRKEIASLDLYFVVPRVSKWAIFIPALIDWLPGDLNIVVASEDFYILGILRSNIHRLWVKAQSSTLRYFRKTFRIKSRISSQRTKRRKNYRRSFSL
jgi:hypothetical protein